MPNGHALINTSLKRGGPATLYVFNGFNRFEDTSIPSIRPSPTKFFPIKIRNSKSAKKPLKFNFI